MCLVAGLGLRVQPEIKRRLKGGIDGGAEPARKCVLRNRASPQVEVVSAHADVLGALWDGLVKLQRAVPVLNVYLARSGAPEPCDVLTAGQTCHGNGRRMPE